MNELQNVLFGLIKDFKSLALNQATPGWRTLSLPTYFDIQASRQKTQTLLQLSNLPSPIAAKSNVEKIVAQPPTPVATTNTQTAQKAHSACQGYEKGTNPVASLKKSSSNTDFNSSSSASSNSNINSSSEVCLQIGPFLTEKVPHIQFVDCPRVKSWFEQRPQLIQNHSQIQKPQIRAKSPRLSPVIIVHNEQSSLKDPLLKLCQAIKNHFAHCCCYVDSPSLQDEVRQGLSRQLIRLIIVDSHLKADIWDPHKKNILVVHASDLESAELKLRLWRRIENALKIS